MYRYTQIYTYMYVYVYVYTHIITTPSTINLQTLFASLHTGRPRPPDPRVAARLGAQRRVRSLECGGAESGAGGLGAVGAGEWGVCVCVVDGGWGWGMGIHRHIIHAYIERHIIHIIYILFLTHAHDTKPRTHTQINQLRCWAAPASRSTRTSRAGCMRRVRMCVCAYYYVY